MQKTIVSIKPGPDNLGFREWNGGQYGPAAFIDVVFSDGDEGSYSTKPDKAPQHVANLTALMDQPTEFELESKAEYNGTPQWKIKDYPGNPAQKFQGGGGGGGWKGNAQTPEEKAHREANILAQSSVKAAVELVKMTTPPGTPLTDADVLASVREFADAIVAMVQDMAPAPVAAPVVAAPVAQAQAFINQAVKAEAQAAAPADVWNEAVDEWQTLYDEAVALFGSPTRLQIATKKNPDELTLPELKKLIADAQE